MIRLLELAEFNRLTCPIDRNRESISLRLDPTKFQVIAMANRSDFPEHIKIINTQSGKFNKVKSYLKISFTEADIIHTRGWPESVVIIKLWKIKNPHGRHVCSVHGLPDKKINYHAEKWLTRNAEVVHCVSKFTANQVKAEYGVESVVIYNGIDTKLFKPVEHYNERIKILFVGSYVERKKPQYVIELAKKFPNCDFIMYGGHSDSYLFERISKTARKLNNLTVNTAISWYNLMKVFQTSDIFVFPSLHEGFANVLVEATACGNPVVAFNTASSHEIISHGENGLLSDLIFKKGDMNDLKALNFSKIEIDLKDMIKNLQYVIEDEKARKEMGKKGRRRALEFDWDIIVKQYTDLYEEIVEGI